MSKKLIIFDADSMIFTVAWKFRDKNVKAMVTMHLNKFISEVILNSGATHYIGFFGSKKDGAKPNFRYGVDPNYKVNRPPTPEWVVKWRPILFEAMETKWGFVGVDGMEADDAVAISAKYFMDQYEEIIVAACDKDLKQIPGITYYNYEKHEKHTSNTFDAAMNLAVQTLMGDSTDGIKGLVGMGAKTAVKLLSECTTLAQLKWTVARMYAAKEEELRSKAEKDAFAETKAEMIADTTFNVDGKLSDKQIDRLVRIKAKQKLAVVMFDSMPGGWKQYLRTQQQLVTLLTEAPDWFTIPEPIESKLVSNVAQPVKDLDAVENTTEVIKTKVTRPIDNFLYL
jgi:5'-3' exonuclease